MLNGVLELGSVCVQELKWRRASQGSAVLNTHSAAVDDADQKLIERMEHELCIVGILETAVHGCACFPKDEGAVHPSMHLSTLLLTCSLPWQCLLSARRGANCIL